MNGGLGGGRLWLLALLLIWMPLGQTLGQGGGRTGLLLDLTGAVGPATEDYIARSLDQAETDGVELVILRMDTPGGLDTSMRAIIKRVITSRVPVVTYVAPGGARAASAGTYILYASHVAAMAPGTNLGAATPVELGGLPGSEDARDKSAEKPGEDQGAPGDAPAQAGPTADPKTSKLVNDAAAYIRGLAEMRGRNAEWAERAVREAASLPAQEALQLGVIDLVATDLDDLLRQLAGREVRLPEGTRPLATDALELTPLAPDWRNELLAVISNPNLAYILLLVGLYGLIYEFVNPGAVLPGTVGAIALLLALYALHVLPVNYAGVALILLGVGLMVAEAFLPSFGVLGMGGIVALVIGSLILMDTQAPGFGLALPLILAVAAISALLLILLLGMALKARQRPVVTGGDALLQAVGLALEDFLETGTVRVQGEIWAAHSDRPLRNRQPIRVVGRKGLVLEVTALEEGKREIHS